MRNKTIVKKLPLLTLFAASLVLSPAIAMAGDNERSHSRDKYTHDRGHSHVNKHKQRSHGKNHKGHDRYSSARHYDRRYDRYKNRLYHRRHSNEHRYNHHRTYVVNDYYYDDDYYILDPLRFMIGLHTNNIDIILRD